MHPEIAWRQATAHWWRCAHCRQAGGERAQRIDLCLKGQSLLDAWEAAELTWSRLRRELHRERPDAQTR